MTDIAGVLGALSWLGNHVRALIDEHDELDSVETISADLPRTSRITP